jgi:sugar phosphate isomerase/epimerase
MQLAIQLDMLPGDNLAAQFAAAQQLGIQGVEVWAHDLTYDLTTIAAASAETGVRVAGVHHGRQGGILDAHPLERDHALDALRGSIVGAVDLKAAGVTLVPHWYSLALPDLSPFKSAAQLHAELLHFHLRTLSDYTYAIGTNLYLQPVNHYESDFVNRVEQMAEITRKLNHPNVKIAADLYHMMLEERDLHAALRDHADQIGHIHIADSNRGLPGHGMMDFARIAETLRTMDYRGWVVLACGEPGDNHAHAEMFMHSLPACLDRLRAFGFE